MNPAATTGGAETPPPTSGRSIASWWRGRYGAQLLIEIAICGVLLVVYRFIRTINRTDLRTAFGNARDIVRLETWLGLPFESHLQAWLLDHPTLIKLLNHYYIWFHFPAAIGLLLWLYLRHPARYRPIRNLMAFVTFAALVIHLMYPLAPPRMMTGFVDTMREFGPSIYPKNALDGAANQIAAMPSLHFGWAMIEAMAVVSVLRSRWRWLVVIHPALMTLAIVATANHWWIDAAAAALLILGAVAAWRLVQRAIGDRRWSWSRLRFRAAVTSRAEPASGDPVSDGPADDQANDQANDGPSKASSVANDDTDDRRSLVG